MSNLFFVKVTDFTPKKASYYINCNEIKSCGVIRTREDKIIYYVELLNENRNSMCLHHIRKSDYERMKSL